MRIRKMSLYAQVAENLNAKEILPFSAREWNVPLVQSVAYGKVDYPEVMEEIKNVLTLMQDERARKIET
jgi:hypothetical protein